MARVEEMIDLSMQDLVFDDEFITALDEKESVTIQVNLVKRMVDCLNLVCYTNNMLNDWHIFNTHRKR
jgi:hypothetical protein